MSGINLIVIWGTMMFHEFFFLKKKKKLITGLIQKMDFFQGSTTFCD
jgi:hypothetical protein